MNRRDSLKAIGLTTLSTALLIDACKPETKTTPETAETTAKPDEAGRQPFEVERTKKLEDEKFFTKPEMATITALADIIIPKDQHSGSASDAKVPEFIEFIVKDIPEHQVPMRGGLRWLDVQCLNRYNHVFVDCNPNQQTEMVTAIAYPLQAKPEMVQGVNFFNRMRDLTATGFFSSEMGIKDIGFVGNQPNQWKGVPEDVLKQYGMEDLKV